MAEAVFVLMFRSAEGERQAHFVIESLRAFGETLGDYPIWAFVLDPVRVSRALPGMEGVHRLPLAVEGECARYPFADKVFACARAEEMAGPTVRSLVWLSLDSLIVRPPFLFDLDPSFDAAFRTVHHRNVGSLAYEPLDGYWRGIYQALGVDDMSHTVESFVDSQVLRPYFNTHCFSLNPTKGLFRAWWEAFMRLVSDEGFQSGPCHDELHQVFLHQAVLSTLVAQRLAWERICLLPSEYNYPVNLLPQMPPERRAPTLNGLVSAVYEDAFPWGDIEVLEPLRSWLRERLPGDRA